MRIYAPSVVLSLWAVLWTLDVRGDLVIVIGLLATAGAVVVHANAYLEDHAGS